MRALCHRLYGALNVAVLLGSSPAAGLGFDCITNNAAGDCSIGEAQLTVDVTDPGGDQVLFTFSNAGPAASVIADVYFDDGSLLQIASILNTPSMVAFSESADPPNLPGASNASPPFQATFSADADAPAPTNGVNPGESLGILFDLQTGTTFADVLADLADGSLRVGIHVQSFATGGSESFVNVPGPGPLTLLALGFGGVALGRRWRLPSAGRAQGGDADRHAQPPASARGSRC